MKTKQSFIHIFFLSIFLLIPFLSRLHSQENHNYSLLWKIESDNSKKPSYLFGTMHVDDSKAFNFSDAVMPAIENSDFFALEIEPEEAFKLYSAKKYTTEAYLFYKELLSENYYKKLNTRFRKMNGISLEESNIYNPEDILSRITPDPEKSDDKSTFVDMYLYEIAQTLQKKVIGLEALETQVNYFDNLSKKQKIEEVKSYLDYNIKELDSIRESMADIYSSGDLSKIESYLLEYDFDDPSFIDRNYVMRNSIIKYINEGSIFAAVGAAHLPGEKGLINLLKEKGYKVSVVEANFTGIADTYKIDNSKKKWYSFIDDTLNFKVKIPKAPNISDDFEKFIIYGYADITSATNYLFMGYDTGFDFSKEQQPKLMNNIINNIIVKRGGTNLKIDSTELKDRLIYKVVSDLEDDTKLKAELTFKNNCIYYFSAEGNDIETYSIDKFFNSIEIKGIEKKKNKDPEWKTLVYEKGKFKISVPNTPKDVSRETPNPLAPDSDPYILNMYMSIDLKNNNNYIYRYNDLPVGYYNQNPEKVFEATKNTFAQKSTVIKELSPISLDGYEGREYELLIQDKYHSIARVYIRGNRTYLLLKQKLNTTEKVNTDDSFFKDFEFTPYSSSNIEYTSLTNSAFEIDLFKNVKHVSDSASYYDRYVKDSNDFYSTNPETGGVYHINYSNLKEYFRIQNMMSFFNEYKQNILEANDTIIDESYYTKGKDSMFLFKVKEKNSLEKPSLKHYASIIKNNRLFTIETYINEEEVETGTVNHIINSLKIKPNQKKIDVYKSKAKTIFENLKSKDSLIYNSALEAFNYYVFNNEELPILYKALYDKFPNDTINTIQNKIVDEFSNVSNIETLKVLKEYYGKVKNDEIKALILGTLSDLKTDDRLDVYKELLSDYVPLNSKTYNYSILRPFRDSLSFASNNYKTLLSLLSHKELRSNIIDITSKIIATGKFKLTEFNNGYEELYQFIENDWDKYLSPEKDNYYEIISSYVDFFNEVKYSNSKINRISQEILDSDEDAWLRLRTLMGRIHNDLEINQKTFNHYIEDLYSRFELMEALKNKNQFDRVPKKYLDKIEFAKLSLYNYIIQDNAIPSEIKHLGNIEKLKSNYAIYSISYEEGTFIGIVDISHSVIKQNKIEQFYSYIDWEELKTNWKEQAEIDINLINNRLD